MGHGKAKFTESDAGRIFKAARKAGVDVKVEFRPDGTIVATTGKTALIATAHDNNESKTNSNPWDEVLSNAANEKRPS